MNEAQIQEMQECAQGSLSGTLTFPEIVGRLAAVGVERYHADYSRQEKTYYLPSGESHVVALPHLPSSDSGVLEETVHRLKLAGKQVIKRPSLLLDVVKKLELKALWVPDRKRILIDSELPSAKQRWGEAHEIGHGIIPWHEAVLHGDKKHTLSYTCEQHIEAEANYAAGRLLFLQDAFVERLRSSPIEFARVKELGREFGNTMTSTLWRVVESMAEPAFGLIGQHPKHVAFEEPTIRYFLRSRRFLSEFENVTALEVFGLLRSFCHGARGPIGSSDVVLQDGNGTDHIFFVEAFNNSHETLTLGTYRGVRPIRTGISH